jgi:sugar lactone lactonase YvrE
MVSSAVRTVLDGLYFGEGPRWHEGALYFSDMHGHRVVRTDLQSPATTVVEITHDEPSGLGWLPDGRMLVVAMETQKLLRVENDGTVVEHADLSGLARGSINDMIVRADGTAYVGDMGSRIHEGGERRPGQTIKVTPDGGVSCAADDLASPNGHILTDDGKTLIVAESAGSCLTAFAVGADGELTGRHTFAVLHPDKEGLPVAPPDGICLDEAGCVWLASPRAGAVIRVSPTQGVTDEILIERRRPYACMLGGEDRRDLYICLADDHDPEGARGARRGAIAVARVAVAGSGYP